MYCVWYHSILNPNPTLVFQTHPPFGSGYCGNGRSIHWRHSTRVRSYQPYSIFVMPLIYFLLYSWLPRYDVAYRPSTNFYSSVYSISPTPTLLGLMTVYLSWDLLLSNALPNNLHRIDWVVTTKTTTFTLAVDQGTVIVVGKGDFHEPSMTAFGQKAVIDLSQKSPLSASDFTITIYPSSAFYNQYNTSQPLQLG